MKYADKIFVNASVITVDPDAPTAQAVAVARGRILAVGDNSDALAWRGPATEVIDLHGQTITPGFNDSHLHFLYPGTQMRVNVLGARSITAMIDTARATLRSVAPGTPVDGWGWDQNLFAEHRYPDRHDLDRAAPQHPLLLINVGGHASAANTAMLAYAGIDRTTPDPDGGHIVRDAAGEPTGLLQESATRLVMQRLYPPHGVFAASDEALKAALRRTMETAVRTGLTSATTDDSRFVGGFERCFRLYRELWAEGAPMVRTSQLVFHDQLDDLIAAGLKSGDGDERLRVGAIKFFQDGSFLAQTAALHEPFTDKPETRGILIHPQAEFDAMILAAHRAGMQVAIHTIGDAGIDSCLDAIERAQAAHPRVDVRPRLVHYEILSESILRRSKALGIVADIQPRFVTSQAHVVESHLGPKRAKLAFPWLTVRRAGIPIAGGSDYPVEPFAPLPAIGAAVTRRSDSQPDLVHLPDERLTVMEAIELFTLGSAYATFEENSKGSITVGKLADLVVLGADPRTAAPEEIRDIPVVMTISGGEIVYSAG